jgi:hypothetical protein
VRSRLLESSLTAFLEEAAVHLAGDTAAGAEVAFEVVAQPSRLHRTPLYCYRPLTGEFIRERDETLRDLPAHGAAVHALASLEGLERYLLARGASHIPADRHERALGALRALLDDVFDEQTEFALRPERVADALRRLEDSAVAGAEQITLLATLSGLAMSSAELALTGGLTIAQPDALRGIPDDALATVDAAAGAHLLVVLTTDELDPERAAAHGREVLRDLLRALRLFGDGRVTLGRLAWTRVGAGNWRPLSLGGGGRPRGMLVVTPDQEDELRAFCSLVSRRAPHGNEVAWALARYDMGCERASDGEALSDHLLALRALLEPEGSGSGLLPGRLAALCAAPERRAALAARTAQAVALEHAIVSGSVTEQPGDDALVRAIADHLRALLRDVICGHLDADLPRVADDLLAAEQAEGEAEAALEPESAEPDLPWEDVQDDGYDDVPDEVTTDAVVARDSEDPAPHPARAAPYPAPQDMLPF